MKTKGYFLSFILLGALFFSSCNCCQKPNSASAGTSLQDTILPKLLVKLVHTGSQNYLAYYWTNSLVVDTTHTPNILTLTAQSARYDSTNNSYVLHNGATTSQVSSNISLYTDTVHATCAGPFDPTTGQFYTSKGYLHYSTKLAGGPSDTLICPVACIVYYNQKGTGLGINVGYIGNADLHSPLPPSKP